MEYHVLIESRFGKLCRRYDVTMIPNMKGIRGISSSGDKINVQCEWGTYTYSVPDVKIKSKKDMLEWIRGRFDKALERDRKKGKEVQKKYLNFK